MSLNSKYVTRTSKDKATDSYARDAAPTDCKTLRNDRGVDVVPSIARADSHSGPVLRYLYLIEVAQIEGNAFFDVRGASPRCVPTANVSD